MKQLPLRVFGQTHTKNLSCCCEKPGVHLRTRKRGDGKCEYLRARPRAGRGRLRTPVPPRPFPSDSPLLLLPLAATLTSWDLHNPGPHLPPCHALAPLGQALPEHHPAVDLPHGSTAAALEATERTVLSLRSCPGASCIWPAGQLCRRGAQGLMHTSTSALVSTEEPMPQIQHPCAWVTSPHITPSTHHVYVHTPAWHTHTLLRGSLRNPGPCCPVLSTS